MNHCVESLGRFCCDVFGCQFELFENINYPFVAFARLEHNEPVSSDTHSATFAVDQTKVIGGTFVRIVAWYDNEWGFSNRMADTAVAMSKLG